MSPRGGEIPRSAQPLIEILQIGDSEPELPAAHQRQAPSVRHQSRVVRSSDRRVRSPAVRLAEQGTQVLDLANPALEVGLLVQDTHVGFRSTFMDLSSKSNISTRPSTLIQRRGHVVARKLPRASWANSACPPRLSLSFAPGSLRRFAGSAGMAPGRTDGRVSTGRQLLHWPTPALEGTADAPQLPATVILNDLTSPAI